MSVIPFLARLTGALDRAGVPYMLAGSFASSFHGEPRMTQDVDLVIATDRDGVLRLADELGEEDWYVDRDTALDALRRGSWFNIIDLASGWKADLIVRKARPFSVSEFRRRERVPVAGLAVWMATREDIVIAKLEWAQRTGSTRQLRDVAGILRAGRGTVDEAYLSQWIAELGLTETWEAVRGG